MIQFDVKNALAVSDRLKLAMMPPERRKRLLEKVMRQAVKDAKQNLRNQQTPDGKPWKKRQQGRRKMLRKMGRGLKVQASSNEGVASWKDKTAGKNAYKHQYGLPEIYTKAKARKRSNQAKDAADQNGPATRHQARLLRRLGYSITTGKKVKRTRKPGLAWIQKNMSYEQAGKTLQMLIAEKRNKAAGKTSWEITVPARPFLEIDTGFVINALVEEFNRRR